MIIVTVSCDQAYPGSSITVTFAEGTVLCGARFLASENLAIGRPAKMTNPVTDGAADLAVNGALVGRSTEECATSLLPGIRKRKLDLPDAGSEFTSGAQFLRIDLEKVSLVAEVHIYTYMMINPFEVRVGNSSDMSWYANPSCGSWQYKASTARVTRVTCGLTGRYVSIVVRDETKAVSLCEVEVYGVSELTFGGTGEGAPCQFPFVSEGEVVRKGCVMGGSEEGQADRPWCYVVPEEADQNWGYCQHAEEVNSCAFSNGGCSDLCFNTPVGVRCGCSDHIPLLEDGKTCAKNPCLDNNGGCQDSCHLSEEGPVCGCPSWFKLNDDKITCSPATHFLIGANKTTIFNMTVDSDPGSLKVVVETEVDNAIGVAFSQSRQLIFWSDASHDAVYSANYDGSNRRKIASVAITVDYSGNRIFWVDAKTKRVEGADLDGGNRMILQSTDLVHPFGATIYGDEIFWTDWGRSSVEAVNKDGTNRRTVFSGIKQPMNIYSLETQSGVGACSVSPCRDGICLAVNETDYQCYCDRYVTPDPTTGSCGK
eukprot:sb/3463694/